MVLTVARAFGAVDVTVAAFGRRRQHHKAVVVVVAYTRRLMPHPHPARPSPSRWRQSYRQRLAAPGRAWTRLHESGRSYTTTPSRMMFSRWTARISSRRTICSGNRESRSRKCSRRSVRRPDRNRRIISMSRSLVSTLESRSYGFGAGKSGSIISGQSG